MTDRKAWQPSSEPAIAEIRAGMLARSRAYFQANDVLEVDTPALSRSAVSDPHIESVAVTLTLDNEAGYFLHTSPEYCMKRLLCDGYPDIYQICKVFRDKEIGRHHQPEFTMVEWYRLGFGLRQISNDTLEFIAGALERPELAANAVHIDYADAFKAFAGCDPFKAGLQELIEIVDADAYLIESVGDDKDTWLDLVLDRKVVPGFAPDRLTVLTHYPLSQAALARECPANPATADRFEVFLGQFELANGYVELTDADEYARRFARDQAARKLRGQTVRPLDNEFLDAIRDGLPECAGVAVGLDRLLMINAGTTDISDVQTFTFTNKT
jgi:lysyl-tRNA synthetase class 2